MEKWFLTVLVMHGLPIMLGLALYFLLTWEGRVMENIICFLVAGCLFVAADWWWKVIKKGGMK